jgi:hypothetical protein
VRACGVVCQWCGSVCVCVWFVCVTGVRYGVCVCVCLCVWLCEILNGKKHRVVTGRVEFISKV